MRWFWHICAAITGTVAVVTGTIYITLFVYEFFMVFGSGFIYAIQPFHPHMWITVDHQYQFHLVNEYLSLLVWCLGTLFPFFFFEGLALK